MTLNIWTDPELGIIDPNPTPACWQCDATAGSFRVLDSGAYECLSHLPKLGRRANRDHR